MIEPEDIATILYHLRMTFDISEKDARQILFVCWDLDEGLRQTQTAEELKLQCFQYVQRLRNSQLV